MSVDSIFAARDLRVAFTMPDGETVEAVRGVDFELKAGECLGIVGESGSGKSQSALAALGLLARNGTASGTAMFAGRNLLAMSRRELEDIRGKHIGLIFQDSLTALTPHLCIGDLLEETLARHGHTDTASMALEWLKRVRIPEARRRMEQFPHQLSGGMRQRIMIALAMAGEPELLIADEPTTALDVTVQAEILELMDELKNETGTGLLLITHDMGVVARMCDRVIVMRYGEVVEQGSVDTIFSAPKTDYARMLIDAAPRLDNPPAVSALPEQQDEVPALQVRDLHVKFATPKGFLAKPGILHAVDNVSFSLRHGETLGVVGESGCGKSSLARAVLRLIEPQADSISWLGRDISGLPQREMRALRAQCQIVFQDPVASLDPRMKVASSVSEPLRVFQPELTAKELRSAAIAAMQRTGLDPELADRYPHQLSGGQNQRINIARAMITNPEILVCDEAVSALDVSVQDKVISLLAELQRETGIAILFISHDLAVVKNISHRVMVLYLGRVMEMASSDDLFANPRHPYSRALLAAAPQPDPACERARTRVRLSGEPPSPMDPGAAFRFLPSRLGQPDNPPQLLEVAPGHWVSEHDPDLGL